MRLELNTFLDYEREQVLYYTWHAKDIFCISCQQHRLIPCAEGFHHVKTQLTAASVTLTGQIFKAVCAAPLPLPIGHVQADRYWVVQ